MTIASTIVVRRNRDEVWSFLADLRNAPRWDRSIARATVTSDGAIGTGAIVETTSPGGKRQSFRIIAFEPPRVLTFTSSRREGPRRNLVLRRRGRHSATPTTADRLVDDIFHRFDLLSEQPGMGRARPEFGIGVRSFAVENYVIYYRQEGPTF